MKNFLIFIYCIFILSACYSFKGFSIPPEIERYRIGLVDISANNIPSELSIVFSETLKDKIQKESRLKLDENNFELEINADITSFLVSSVAPEEGSTTALNRLEIVLSFNYNNIITPDDSWTKTYSDFEDFPAEQSIGDVQDQLVEIIFDDMIDRIFNDAFTSW